MSTCFEQNHVVGGLFKIRGETAEAVIEFVREWKDGYDGERFERLAVRDCTGKSKRDYMVAIDFLFAFENEDPSDEESERMHSAFFHKYTDLLRRRFGNGLAVWDVSTPVYEIVG